MPRTRLLCLTLALPLAAMLVACKTVPRDQLAAADYGPAPHGYQMQIKQYFGVNEYEYAGFVKPDWRFEKPYRAALLPEDATDWQFGHAVDMTFNRKRRYQGYAYNEKHTFFFNNSGRMHHLRSGDTLRAAE